MPNCASCGQANPDGFRFCGRCGSALAGLASEQEQRKIVTVLFCDVTGSTALGERLDPEPLRRVLARYFEVMKRVVESHGGTVDKFIGDAVEAVFGVPVVHEDDALRALRAAAGMRDALAELNGELARDYGTTLEMRIGVTTGEVVAGTAERLVTGDAVNVAARLEQAAQPGEILVGAETVTLARDAVLVEAVAPLVVRGKSEPVPAWRLLSAPKEDSARRFESPFVGRERELLRLDAAWEQVCGERRCELVTVVGAAGVGKSRLVAEFLARLDAVVARGRCLPYGEGITYWPVVDVVRQLEPRLAGLEVAADVGEVIAGLFANEAAASSDEIAWSFRKLLEVAAAERPLVVVFDDIQWGEETFLDLLEHAAYLSSGAPLLLCCMARLELLERRRGWGGVLRLEPLPPDEAERLLDLRLSGEELASTLRRRIVAAAGGYPLFVEEMTAMLQQAEHGAISVPPTIRALLAARLDQLEAGERRLLERGAVEGEVFHRGALQALAPEETHLATRLTSLVRKELIRPDQGRLAGEDAFGFRHLLIRDAAYDAVPKSTRAELHERFAGWLEKQGQSLIELDELAGYHLEQACRYRRELGAAEDALLARRAHARLAAAGRRALGREDFPAAVNLLERAAAVSVDELDVALEDDLCFALVFAGRIEEANRRAARAAERAAAAADANAELHFRILETEGRTSSDPEGAIETLEALALRALPRFEAAGDDLDLSTVTFALALVAYMRLQPDTAAAGFEQALAHARRLGERHRERNLKMWIVASRRNGSAPVSDLIPWLEEEVAQGLLSTESRSDLALARAMAGQIEEARTEIAAVLEALAERGMALYLAGEKALTAVKIELLAGDPAAALKIGAEGWRRLDELGMRGSQSTAAAYLAQALYELDRLDEAQTWAGRSRELGASDDLMTQALWRQIEAKLLARRGEADEAERLVREALAIVDPTQHLTLRADCYRDLAAVLELVGKPQDARAALEQALNLYERKGNLVMAERVRERLDRVAAPMRG